MEGDPPGREVVEGGGIDVLLEISDSNKCRTLLLRTTKTLAAYQLGKERSCKQLHTNETGRQQKQLVNVVINIINESGDFKSICLSGSIIAESRQQKNKADPSLHPLVKRVSYYRNGKM